MVRSMTGFGRATSEEGKERIISLEMKSVNHRYLDMNIRMPKSFIALEDKIRRVVNEKLNRGKVDIFINYKNYGHNQAEVKLNTMLADSYVKCLSELEERYSDIKNDISLSLISRYPEIITLEEKEDDLDEIWLEVKELLEKALIMMVDMRMVEGEKLSEDIAKKCILIEDWVNQIDSKSDVVVENYRVKLKDRVEELLGDLQVDEARIAMEVAVFADKATIDEEITRLRSHIIQLRNTLALNEPIGRKLDFIVQEINREANTIASKSTDIEITNLVINIKNMIEKIREQIQNIE
ncbi:TIGR00255 family protein [Clostridium cavendishii DSM 21758]|uniref:TIGR00255 family protein n=1 Tax=Clostridium cavendishii DSM 21758 TaxID=1121302 RepID=A0A1M6KAQ9_9CLOT|nr:YicC/YloC family endoribonuclease [Clostridium cavendishii]SHJ56018.1 TIGR00255 family protein [Clostridium cavendishii DSM 21758]